MVVGVCSGLSVCLAVPYVLVAGGNVECGVVVITDCKMERIDTGAIFFISIRVVVPSVGVTGILCERLVCTVVDGEV